MKKIIIIISVLILTSCSVAKYPYKRYSSAIDFKEIIGSDFFLTESNSVNFNYDALGSVSAVIESGYEVIDKSNSQTLNDYSSLEEYERRFGKYIQAKPEDAILELILAARKLRANGIINLKIIYTPPAYGNYGILISPSSYVVSGMAINKKD